METFLLAMDVLVAIGLITLILLQHGRGADAGAAFGSGASQTVFGSQGSASFLTRATGVLAMLFFAISLLLASISGPQGDGSVTEGIAESSQSSAPKPTGSPSSTDVPAVPLQSPNEDSAKKDSVPDVPDS